MISDKVLNYHQKIPSHKGYTVVVLAICLLECPRILFQELFNSYLKGMIWEKLALNFVPGDRLNRSLQPIVLLQYFSLIGESLLRNYGFLHKH